MTLWEILGIGLVVLAFYSYLVVTAQPDPTESKKEPPAK